MIQKTHKEKVVVVGITPREHDGNNKLFFLFTASQVEEVLSDTTILPVPFAPPFLAGMSLWRGHLLPVIDIQKRFSFSVPEDDAGFRYIVVRTGGTDISGNDKILRCVLRISESIRPIDVPDVSEVISSENVSIESSLIRGIYRCEHDMYIVPDLVSILQN